MKRCGVVARFDGFDHSPRASPIALHATRDATLYTIPQWPMLGPSHPGTNARCTAMMIRPCKTRDSTPISDERWPHLFPQSLYYKSLLCSVASRVARDT